MSNEKQVDSGRRGLLAATCAVGGVAGLATAGAFVSTFQPSERAKAAGAPTELKIYPPFQHPTNPNPNAPGHALFSPIGVDLWKADVLAFLVSHIGQPPRR